MQGLFLCWDKNNRLDFKTRTNKLVKGELCVEMCVGKDSLSLTVKKT